MNGTFSIHLLLVTGTMSASLSSIPSSLMSFASSSGKQKHIPRDEMIDRYKLVINRATEYLLFSCKFVSNFLFHSRRYFFLPFFFLF